MPSEQQQTDGYAIKVTHTARSKAFRYLPAYEIRRCLRSPREVYHESHNEYLVRTDRKPDPKNYPKGRQPGKKNPIVLIVALEHDDEEIVVVTQTGDHYDWSNYDRVSSLGVPIAGDGGEADADE